MPQRCQVCTHPKTQEIDHQIVQGIPHKKIAAGYEGLDYQNIWRHAQNHLPDKLVKAVQNKEQKHAQNILDGITDLLDRTKNILDDAEEAGQKTTALSAIREARSIFELLSKIAVRLEEYRREDEKKKSAQAENQIMDGLEVLSDKELIAFNKLLAKIHAADPNYDLDPTSRLVVDALNRGVFDDYQPVTSSPQEQENDQHRGPESPRTRPGQPKNTKTRKDTDDLDLDLDDLDLDDLNLSNEIPSEETDPAWLREERRKRRRRNR